MNAPAQNKPAQAPANKVQPKPAPAAATPAPVAAPQEPAKPVVSDETRARWRVMLANQMNAGRNYDLGQLVETVVSRICDEQSASIGASAKGMTEIDAVRDAVRSEFMRGKEIVDKPGSEALRAPFQGNTILRVTGAEQQPLNLKKGQANSTINRSHVQKLVKYVPLESPIYTRKVLLAHMDKLAKQDTNLQQERATLDERMKKALEERTRIVSNLSLVSKELYELAKEVAATMPKPAAAAVKPQTMPAQGTQSSAKPAPTAQAKPMAAQATQSGTKPAPQAAVKR